MGSCASKDGEVVKDSGMAGKVEVDQVNQNRKIEQELAREKVQMRKTVKLLLLGPGESGKSTILKQLRILHQSGFSESEIKQRAGACYTNAVTAMVILLQEMKRLGIKVKTPDRESEARYILKELDEAEYSNPFTDKVYTSLKNLWADDGVMEAFKRRTEFEHSLSDSAQYFMSNLNRLYEKDFKPTNQDMLMSRVQTLGVHEIKFPYKNLEFRVFDVGGQKTERRKWVHCFDDVSAIIFITAVSEYDMLLREDPTMNRMIDSLQLFHSICNNEYFCSTSMILFLNKTDLFEEKIKHVPLTVCFPQYTGKNNFEDGMRFLQEKHDEQNLNPERAIYVHKTCATDTGQVQVVLDSVLDTLLTENIKGAGLA